MDLSKTLVYRFYYQYMRRRVNCKLLYTDTDSLVYEVTNANIYNIMRDDIHEFDTSDYSADNLFNMPRVNKKIVGLMKDECNGQIMLEFPGLRSKMCSIRVQNQKPIKNAKGVKTSIVKNTITFDDYIKGLHENVTIRREQRNIRSRRHLLHTEREMKLALSACDDKRHLLPGQIDTMPWGHYMVGELENDVGWRNRNDCSSSIPNHGSTMLWESCPYWRMMLEWGDRNERSNRRRRSQPYMSSSCRTRSSLRSSSQAVINRLSSKQ